MRTLRCPETSGFDFPVERHRIVEECNPQKMYFFLLDRDLTIYGIKLKALYLLIFCVLVNKGCPTRYRTRNFFNNCNTNEDIATNFEQGYVRCVRNEEECVCSVCL
jgi:hypothetical protein